MRGTGLYHRTASCSCGRGASPPSLGHAISRPPASMTLAIVSNRLPVSLKRTKQGLSIRPNPGGVVAGLSSVHSEFGATWFGWPGDVPEGEQDWLRTRLTSEFACHPIFLPRRLARSYYTGFSNGTLWPLLHAFPSYARYSPADWDAYREANLRFANAIVETLEPEGVVWIHDYHLMLLPQIVRERKPDVRIGFFLHTPFPPYDVLRSLPWIRSILDGILGADLVGFHTYDDADAFLGSVRRVLGLDNDIGTILLRERSTHVDVFPLGIDFQKLVEASEKPTVFRTTERIRRGLGDSKLLLSISRLDYTKGIPQQLEAYDQFLDQYPAWRGKVTYFLAVVPSREQVLQYAQLKRQIDQSVGRINSEYGTLGWTPIRYLYRQLAFDELLALYRASDVALISPLRDGMNLIAKEYLAAKTDGRGVLVLSEMAGSSKELLEALLVNPNSTTQIAHALHLAVTMSEAEQVERNRAMREHLQKYDARMWAARFLERLNEAAARSREVRARRLRPPDRTAILRRYRSAGRRLFLLDYDGTLVTFTEDREAAVPPPRVLRTLKALGSDGRNRVVLISGRTRHNLERWFVGLPISLVAEHGGWIKPSDGEEWETAIGAEASWKKRIRPIMDRFVERVSGSSVEEKDFSLAWHYREADVKSGPAAARELIHTLTILTSNMDLQVLSGNMVVEIKRSGTGKGAFFSMRLAREPWDFILAAGDDATDESLFLALPPEAVSIRVGAVASASRFNLDSPDDVLNLLEVMVRPATSP